MVSAASADRSAAVAKRAALLGTGPFGRRVTGLLARATGGRELPPDSTVEDAFAAAPSAVVLALWRPAPSLCERADSLAHETGVPWLPITMQPALLQVGPLVVPGAGPCYRCFEERRMQHDRQSWSTAALLAAYDKDPDLGPGGYLPQHARTAAALAATVLGSPGHGTGQVLSAALHTGAAGRVVHRDPVVACHGCLRCERPLPGADLRTLLRLTYQEPAGVS